MQFEKNHIFLLYLNWSIMSVINKFDFNINSNNDVFDLFKIDDTFNDEIVFVII